MEVETRDRKGSDSVVANMEVTRGTGKRYYPSGSAEPIYSTSSCLAKQIGCWSCSRKLKRYRNWSRGRNSAYLGITLQSRTCF